MQLVVIIPTFARKAVLGRTLAHLAGQTRLPELIVVAAPDESHVDTAVPCAVPCAYVFGARGSSAQRNAALDSEACRSADVAVFFDDDFVPAADYLANVVDALAQHPEWAGLTGTVVADGVKGPGLTFEAARAILDQTDTDAASRTSEQVTRTGAYGCNMAFRLAEIGSHRFDERLPLYGWQEDTDFSCRVARGRPIMRLNSLRGVHLGVKQGRSSGVRFGYSQIVNPLYLVRKGTGTGSWAANLIVRNVLANVALSFRPEPHVDRVGRLKGNLIAAGHLLRGRCDPEFIMRL